MLVKRLSMMAAAMLLLVNASAQTFSFVPEKKLRLSHATAVSAADRYSADTDYGFDFIASPANLAQQTPFFFSLRVPDGNYRVTLWLGSSRRSANTTVRAESRRLLVENLTTRKGELRKVSFVVNKHSPRINEQRYVRIKERERTKLNWDDRLTIEVNGTAPACAALSIEPDTTATTIFLCGNSTVVDQDYEPWASWGQMVTRWFSDRVCIANFAESGETASTFIQVGRLDKALSMMRPGDYLVAEFGHNDQKQHRPGDGPYYNFATALKTFIDLTRAKGATPLFATPTQRRAFTNGALQETHGEYPEAMRWVAKREGVPVIELHELTRTLFETLGEEGSKRALVHYPAGTFPGQTSEFKDNTHFNPYGAYEVAKCVLTEMLRLNIPLTSELRDFQGFDPAHPDNPDTFQWCDSPFFEALKPDGN